jgi:hypothetical protein
MKLNELVRGIDTWTSNEEQAILDRLKELSVLENFEEHEQQVIEGLVRKSLIIKVPGHGINYIYPNV